MNSNATLPNNTSRFTMLSWAGSMIFHGFLILLGLEIMAHVTTQPSSQPLKWNVSLVKPMPTQQPTQPRQRVKPVTPTPQTPITRPQPKTQVTQQQRSTPQPITHQVVHRSKPQPVTAQTHTPQRSLPKTTTQASVRQSPAREVTKSQHVTATRPQPQNTPHHKKQASTVNTTSKPSTKALAKTITTVQAQSSVQQPSSMVTSPSQATLAKAVSRPAVQETNAQSATTSQTSVERPLSHQQSLVTRSTAQQSLKPAIYAGRPNRLSAMSKPLSTPTHKVVSRPKPSKRQHVASNKLSPEVLAFLKLLREKIQRHREYPRVAKRLGYHGVTTVAFSLSKRGDLTLLKVSEPSGHSVLDQAALEAIKKVLPLKPPSMMGNAAIEIPVSFELRR